jgi:hypothetical protein
LLLQEYPPERVPNYVNGLTQRDLYALAAKDAVPVREPRNPRNIGFPAVGAMGIEPVTQPV